MSDVVVHVSSTTTPVRFPFYEFIDSADHNRKLLASLQVPISKTFGHYNMTTTAFLICKVTTK